MSGMGETYAFIDAQNFLLSQDAAAAAWTGSPVEPDIRMLGPIRGVNKLFYYDCLDENQTQQERHNHEARLERVQSLDGAHVRTGWLTGRGRNRRQKGVDVQIAVDMMHHAARGNMSRAVLVSGDADFAPLVDALVEMGIHVTVAADRTSTAAELRRSADAYSPLSFDDYFQTWPTAVRNKWALPTVHGETADPDWVAFKRCSVGNAEAAILHTMTARSPVLAFSAPGWNHVAWGVDERRLMLYFDLNFGPGSWTP
jgi:hypothetical protein